MHHKEVFRLWRRGLCIDMMHAVASYLCRGIEAVITGLTRNFVVTLEPPTLNPLIYKGFPQFKYNLIR